MFVINLLLSYFFYVFSVFCRIVSECVLKHPIITFLSVIEPRNYAIIVFRMLSNYIFVKFII